MIIIEMLSIIMIVIIMTISCSSVPFVYLFVSSVRCFDDRSPRCVSPQRAERRRRRKGMRARRNRPHRPWRVCPPLIRITGIIWYFLILLIRHWIRNVLTSRSSSFHDGFYFERKISQKRLVYFLRVIYVTSTPPPCGETLNTERNKPISNMRVVLQLFVINRVFRVTSVHPQNTQLGHLRGRGTREATPRVRCTFCEPPQEPPPRRNEK